ncbi:caspase family protein [Dactylosporangium darangshiense]|uniref:caspase family protein n=1 Tax=Dactylosporangium darangshiense TaxID=579108 RepID=UPI003634D407
MDHALVVGCDAYPNSPGADLRGAVADALAVREWLLGPGGVPEANVTCLLSPSGGGLQPPDGVAAGAASVVQFGKAVARLSRVAAGPGDRLFVYFAGHGLRTDPFNPVVAHDALLLHDFDREVPQPGAVGVQDLLSRLELTAFGEVVVVLDACRNFPFPEPFRLGGLGFDGPAAAGTTARIYLLQATEPGSTARGHAVDGVVRGDLTLAVVDALNGVGAAKHFDETAARPYVVDWAGLTRYVEAAVPDQGSARAATATRSSSPSPTTRSARSRSPSRSTPTPRAPTRCCRSGSPTTTRAGPRSSRSPAQGRRRCG